MTVVTPGGTSNALSFTFVAATPGVPANVAFVSPPTSGSVGQSVTFTPATATTTASCGSITSYKIDFGDGSPVQTSATPSATTHTYTSPGTFTVTLTVTDCAGGVASTSTTIAISGPAGPAIAVAAGWNLVSGPSGSVFSQCNGPLYTFQAGNTAYQVVPNTSGIVNGQGYWCFLNAPTTLSLNGQGTTSASISAPPSQWVMVGEPERDADADRAWRGQRRHLESGNRRLRAGQRDRPRPGGLGDQPERRHDHRQPIAGQAVAGHEGRGRAPRPSSLSEVQLRLADDFTFNVPGKSAVSGSFKGREQLLGLVVRRT